MRLPVDHALPLILIAALAGGADAYARKPEQPAAPVTGPAADYPVIVGAPFQVAGTTWTPEDKLNYDAVGYAAVASDAGGHITAAHKTLPLPSYVEVTSLDSGRTILVRVERRGPMSNDRLIELSPGGAAQLGLAGSDRPAVRVRRVNPPEQERAMLRTGGRAPERMATPKGLLDALNRKLGASTAAPQLAAAPVAVPAPHIAATPQPKAMPSPVHPAAHVAAAPRPAAGPPAKPATVPAPLPKDTAAPQAPAVANGSLVVQVAALSAQDRATGLADKMGGRVSASGRLWRVRLGPFATQADAQAALAKARVAGYSDARIQRAD